MNWDSCTLRKRTNQRLIVKGSLVQYIAKVGPVLVVCMYIEYLAKDQTPRSPTCRKVIGHYEDILLGLFEDKCSPR